MENSSNIPWWSEEYGFFGSFYMNGDASKDGYLIEKKQSLQERTISEVDGIVKLLNLPKEARILDCPCGYGRHSIELAKRNFSVTGSDINSIHLAKAELDAKKESVAISFQKESMSNLTYDKEFDAVINMFYSFGFFDTDQENEKVLKNFYNALKPGGKFLMHTDVNVSRILAGKYKEDEKRVLETGDVLRVVDKYNKETKRIEGAWIIKNNDREVRKDYTVRVYTKEEFEELCNKVGFSSVTTYGDWQGNPYTEDAEDMVVIAVK